MIREKIRTGRAKLLTRSCLNLEGSKSLQATGSEIFFCKTPVPERGDTFLVKETSVTVGLCYVATMS